MNDMNDMEVSLPKNLAKGGGKETLFRVTIRGQIALIGIMDSKADLIISINILLITGVPGFLSGSLYFWNGNPTMNLTNLIPRHLPHLLSGSHHFYHSLHPYGPASQKIPGHGEPHSVLPDPL